MVLKGDIFFVLVENISHFLVESIGLPHVLSGCDHVSGLYKWDVGPGARQACLKQPACLRVLNSSSQLRSLQM